MREKTTSALHLSAAGKHKNKCKTLWRCTLHHTQDSLLYICQLFLDPCFAFVLHCFFKVFFVHQQKMGRPPKINLHLNRWENWKSGCDKITLKYPAQKFIKTAGLHFLSFNPSCNQKDIHKNAIYPHHHVEFHTHEGPPKIYMKL
jgi:hypothetical protein